MDFSDKVAIVTGGGSGIGRAVAQELARRGAVVRVSDIREASAQDTAAGIVKAGGRATAEYADVRRAEDVKGLVDAAVREHGRVDLMFNNAGIGVGGEIRDLTLAD